MKTIGAILLASIFVVPRGERLASAAESAGEQTMPGGTKLPVETYSGYFVSNKFEPNAPASFAVIADQAQFGQIFGVARVMRDKSHRLPPNAFNSRIVLTAIKRGNAIWKFHVAGVSQDKGAIELRYTTSAEKGGSATFACPLIVSVPKQDYSAVVFIEDGKTVKTIVNGAKP